MQKSAMLSLFDAGVVAGISNAKLIGIAFSFYSLSRGSPDVPDNAFHLSESFTFESNRVTTGDRVCRACSEGIAPGIDYRLEVVRAVNSHTLRAACDNRQDQTEVNYWSRLCKLHTVSGSIQMSVAKAERPGKRFRSLCAPVAHHQISIALVPFNP